MIRLRPRVTGKNERARLRPGGEAEGCTVEIRQDRLAVRGRRCDGGFGPRYGELRERCAAAWRAIAHAARDAGGEPPRPGRCTVTLVSVLRAGPAWPDTDVVGRLLGLWRVAQDVPLLPLPPRLELRLDCPLAEDPGAAGGKLEMRLEPSPTADGGRVVCAIRLTASSPSRGDGVGDVLATLDTAREWAARGYAAILAQTPSRALTAPGDC